MDFSRRKNDDVNGNIEIFIFLTICYGRDNVKFVIVPNKLLLRANNIHLFSLTRTTTYISIIHKLYRNINTFYLDELYSWKINQTDVMFNNSIKHTKNLLEINK